MSKTPFEIRQELLVLAKEYLDQQLDIHTVFMKKLVDESILSAEDYQAKFKEYVPMFSVDDIVKQAEKFYAFVDRKEDS